MKVKLSSQQAILQSSHITEDLFRKFERLEQRDFQALLDYSKEAWHTGKKTMYILPDGTTDFLDIDSIDHMESNYGIFVSDAGKDQEKLTNIKGLTQAMMQNGAKPSVIAGMLDSDSFSQIKKNLKSAEKAQAELEAAQQQAQQEQSQQQLEAAQMQQEAEGLEREKDRQKDIEIALINAESKKDQEGHSLNLEKMVRDFELKNRELDIKEQDLSERARSSQNQEDINREANQVKREDSIIKADTARQNANKRN
tara:strand:- start:1921 stop:2682 length:762 start_codon:yes stop_codon:yes gene_type:complete